MKPKGINNPINMQVSYSCIYVTHVSTHIYMTSTYSKLTGKILLAASCAASLNPKDVDRVEKMMIHQSRQGGIQQAWANGAHVKDLQVVSEVNNDPYTVATVAVAAEAVCDSCAMRLHRRQAYTVHTVAGRSATLSMTVLTWRAFRCNRSKAAPPKTALVASATCKRV